MQELENKIKKQQEVITDQKYEIEIANEDAKRYQSDLGALENKVKDKQSDTSFAKLLEEAKGKDTKIGKLNKKRRHLQELLNEKEKIINQIFEDSHMHVNLITIQTKLKETGNIIGLGNKLKEEPKRPAEPVEEIHELYLQFLQHQITKKTADMTASVNEITD